MLEALSIAIETLLTAAGGAMLGFGAGLLAGGPLGAVIGATVAGLNGLAAGARRVYDWRGARGWFAFAADSTWGLVTTTAGVCLAAINTLMPSADYSGALSRRRNRQIYDGGFALQRGMALTAGGVISNANPTGRGFNDSFLSRHEELHIWQARIFGPLFPLVYGVWFTGGLVVGTLVWLFHREESWQDLVRTAGYFDNPFEYWAYRNDEYWPPAGAHPLVAWPPKQRPE